MYRFGRTIFVAVSFGFFAFSILLSTPVDANCQSAAKSAAPVQEAAKPSHWAYRKVILGMNADETRKALGDPKDKSDEQDLYLFTDDELAQIYYDKNHLITAISITFYKDLTKAPTARDVLGEDAPKGTDGSVFKTVRFPKAGYTVSYSKTSGDSPSVSITFQKL